MVNSTPRTPPMRAMRVVSMYLMPVQALMSTKAGMVNMTPAARLSPAEAMVLERFASRMVPPTALNTARDMTAAGMVAETVIPTLRPR